MKILYLITKSNWGGAQRHVFDLAVAFASKGHSIAVAAGGAGPLQAKLEQAGIETHSISALGRDISAGNDAGSFKSIFSLIRRLRPDILHLHSPKAAGLGALAGKLLRCPEIIYTVHGWAFNEDRPWQQRILIRLASWITMLLCDKIILLSDREYAQTLHFPFVKNKLVLIPLGIAPAALISIEGARHEMSKRLGIPPAAYNKKVVIGTIAELHPNKGLNYLIEAMASVKHDHPEALCIIIGEGQEKEALREQIARAGLEETVFLTGFIDQAAEYLKSFSFFILSSVKEGLPYVIFEAGCASLPVVATTVGGIPEVVEDMSSGVLVQPRNSRELAHAISFMIEHPAERKKYGAALKQRILTHFSLGQMIEKTESLYTKTF